MGGLFGVLTGCRPYDTIMTNNKYIVKKEKAMSPRALTEQEKDHQRLKLMAKARELILAHGIRRVSVDDIVKAAGMAKGSFYHHFASKEDLMMQLVWEIYQGFVAQAQTVIRQSPPQDLRRNVGALIRAILSEPDKIFFFNNHEDLEILIASLKSKDLHDFNALEQQAFAGLITLAGRDVQTVKPGVVHNYIHAMYFAVSDDAMTLGDLPETVDAMLEGLLVYIFGPE